MYKVKIRLDVVPKKLTLKAVPQLVDCAPNAAEEGSALWGVANCQAEGSHERRHQPVQPTRGGRHDEARACTQSNHSSVSA